jgi:hypothetical protein
MIEFFWYKYINFRYSKIAIKNMNSSKIKPKKNKANEKARLKKRHEEYEEYLDENPELKAQIMQILKEVQDRLKAQNRIRISIRDLKKEIIKYKRRKPSDENEQKILETKEKIVELQQQLEAFKNKK